MSGACLRLVELAQGHGCRPADACGCGDRPEPIRIFEPSINVDLLDLDGHPIDREPPRRFGVPHIGPSDWPHGSNRFEFSPVLLVLAPLGARRVLLVLSWTRRRMGMLLNRLLTGGSQFHKRASAKYAALARKSLARSRAGKPQRSRTRATRFSWNAPFVRSYQTAPVTRQGGSVPEIVLSILAPPRGRTGVVRLAFTTML